MLKQGCGCGRHGMRSICGIGSYANKTHNNTSPHVFPPFQHLHLPIALSSFPPAPPPESVLGKINSGDELST